MPALVSLLALALTTPGPTAPPLSPTADNDALYKEIVAGDPALTTPPAPLERLVAATELAEEKLRQADDDDDAEDFLTLAVQGRRAAFVRSGEALHLCRMIAAADIVLARDPVRSGLRSAAKDFRQEAQGVVGEKACANNPPPGAETDAQPPDGATVSKGEVMRPSEPPTPGPVIPPAVNRRRIRVGVATLVPGLVLFAPVAALLAYRADVRRELAEINAATAMRPATEAETTRAFALDDRHVATTAAAAVVGTAGGALVVAGAVLLATGKRQPRTAMAPWGGRGVAGLVLQGRF